MARKKQAIKPEYFADLRQIRSLRIKEKAKKVGIDPEEGLLHALSDHDGWKVLEKFINQLLGDLDDLTKSQMEKGADFSEIGRNAVTVQLCKEVLIKILNKVNDAREAVEEKINKEPAEKEKEKTAKRPRGG